MDLCCDSANRIIFIYKFLVVLNSIGDATLSSLAVNLTILYLTSSVYCRIECEFIIFCVNPLVPEFFFS